MFSFRRAFFVGGFYCLSAAGQMLPWAGNDFSLQTRGMALSAVLESLAESYNTPVYISPDIRGRFSGHISPDAPDKILQSLMIQNNLVNYYDGNTLYIYPASQTGHLVLALKTLPGGVFIHYVRQRGLNAARVCEVHRIPGVNAVDITGVPMCLQRLRQLADMLDSDMSRRADDAIDVALVPLRYASAADENYQYRDQTVRVPGVVSVLREMGGSGGKVEGLASGLPEFSADPRQNAVLIRDRSVNIPGYKKLIAGLDHRPEMIEIAVMIIDVDAGEINQLGIDWSATRSLGGGDFSFNGPDGAGEGFSTLVGNTSDFMVRLNALERTSRACVLSQPSVVTLNNVQAVLDRNVTFYTKLEGTKESRLASVTTGALLRVTPRLLNEDGHQEIMLNLNIQDGQQNTPLSQEEPLPQILSSEIASQATLQAGEGLLLGGFRQDKDVQAEKKLPLLGDIPVIGRLFRSDASQKHSVVRLFLIKASVSMNSGDHKRE